MDLTFILFYLTVSFFGYYAIYFSSKLFKTYEFTFLRYLNYFIIFSVIFGFFNWIAPEIINYLLIDLTGKSSLVLISLIRNLGLPFLLIKLYFLYHLIVIISQKKPERWKKLLLQTILLLLFFIHPVIIIHSFKERLSMLEFKFKLIEGHLLVSIQFFLILLLIIKTERYQKTDIKYSANIFGRWYFIGFSIAVIIMSIRGSITQGYYLSIFLFFVILFPPLIAVKYFLKKNSFQPLSSEAEKTSIYNFGSDHKLSEREKDILELILKNKTNNEIEKLLDISIQTVKNNIQLFTKKLQSRADLI